LLPFRLAGRRALVVLPNDPDLVDILAKAGVDISVSEGEQQVLRNSLHGLFDHVQIHLFISLHPNWSCTWCDAPHARCSARFRSLNPTFSLQGGNYVALLGNLLFPIIAFAGLFFLFRGAGGQGGQGGQGGGPFGGMGGMGGPMEFGKSKSKFQEVPETGITFDDVAVRFCSQRNMAQRCHQSHRSLSAARIQQCKCSVVGPSTAATASAASILTSCHPSHGV